MLAPTEPAREHHRAVRKPTKIRICTSPGQQPGQQILQHRYQQGKQTTAIDANKAVQPGQPNFPKIPAGQAKRLRFNANKAVTNKPHAEDSPILFAPAGQSPPRNPGLAHERLHTLNKSQGSPRAISADGQRKEQRGQGQKQFWDQSENKTELPLPRLVGTGDTQAEKHTRP